LVCADNWRAALPWHPSLGTPSDHYAADGGGGVILRRYKTGGLADAKALRLAEGLAWRQGENRTRTEANLDPWLGARGAAGRLVPNGFPRSNRFG
jgi:topoisomerase-4 subunit A